MRRIEVFAQARLTVREEARVLTALAGHTFLEAIRDRVLYLLLFFGLFVAGSSRLLSPLALGQGRRVTCDLGFAAISAFGCLTTIFVGHQLIFREIERKTLYFLFARPVRRSAFVFGKFLGLLITLAAAVLLMGLILAVVLALSHYAFGWPFFQALFLSLCGLSILAALAVLLATVTSPVLAGLLTLAAWLIGHGCADLAAFMQTHPSEGVQALARVFLFVIPHLDLYGDILPVLAGVSYPGGQILQAVLYAAAYSVAALLGASWALSRRELSV